MKFYKCSDDFFINLDLVTNISKKRGDWFVYFVGEQNGKLITPFDVFEIKKILFPKNEG